MTPLFRIAQISDTHLFSDKKAELLGVNTYESFKTIAEMAVLDKPDLILMTGDLAQDCTEAAYIHLADEMNRFQIPVYCLPGNHDDPQMMREVFPREMVSIQKHILKDNWQIILLDSHLHKKVEGVLSDAEFDFMEECLQTYPLHHSLIAFHHQPLPSGSAWLDKIGLKNADIFLKKLQNYLNVKIVMYGHVHQQLENFRNEIGFYSAPATCIQFKPKREDFALDDLPQGYRIMDFYSDGRVKTEVKRVKHYIGHFLQHAKGY